MPSGKKGAASQKDASGFGDMLADLGAALTSFGAQLSQIGARYSSISRVSPQSSAAAASGASPPRTVTLTASPALSALGEAAATPSKKTASDTKEKRAKRQKRDTNAPKRPLTGYLLFCMDNRPAIQASNPALAAVDVVRRLGEMWEKADEKEKESYLEKAKELVKEAEKARQEQAAAASIGESSRESIAISEDGGAAPVAAASTGRKKPKVPSPSAIVDESPVSTPAMHAPATSASSAAPAPSQLPSQQAPPSKDADESEMSKEARKQKKRERKEQREKALRQTPDHTATDVTMTDSAKKRV